MKEEQLNSLRQKIKPEDFSIPQPNEKEWEKELLSIIEQKHCGLGLCDNIFYKTIIPFISNLLSHQRESIREEMDREHIKQITDFIEKNNIVIGVREGNAFKEIDVQKLVKEWKSLLNKGQKENK